MTIANRDPRSKEEFLNRMLSIDFDGDLRHIGPSVIVERLRPNKVALRMLETGKIFTLTVSMPREEETAGRVQLQRPAAAARAAPAPAPEAGDGDGEAEEVAPKVPVPAARRAPARRRAPVRAAH